MIIHRDAFKAAGALIDDGDHGWHPDRCVINGKRMGTGLIVPDHCVSEMYATDGEFPDELLIPESDIPEALAQQIADQSSLYDLRKRSNGALNSLNQGHFGLCWDFDATKMLMYGMAVAGEPIVPLSGWYMAGMIKGWRDQGGQVATAMAYAAEHGCCKSSLCPSYDKKYATAEAEADAAKRKATKFWHGSANDKDKRTHQMISAALRVFPWGVDLNWMGHSMAGCRITKYTSLEKLEMDTDNSWGMEAGVEGLYHLVDGKARPDDLIILGSSMANAA